MAHHENLLSVDIRRRLRDMLGILALIDQKLPDLAMQSNRVRTLVRADPRRSWYARGLALLSGELSERGAASCIASNDDGYDVILWLEVNMRTTVTLDDDLVARAEELTGVRERSALIRDAVELLVRIESGRQLAALGGSDSAAEAAPRSRRRA